MIPAIPIKYARYLIALCFAAWGVLHFMFGDFLIGRPPAWPASLPGQTIIAYASGLVLIATALAMVANTRARTMLVISAGMVLLWAALRNMVVVIPALDYGGALTSMNKGLTIGFGCLLLAARSHSSNTPGWLTTSSRYAKYAVGWFMFASGIQHFIFAEFVQFLVPAWIPGKTFWAYFAGAALIAGGLGLMSGIKRKLAALISGWMIFIWFLILHIPLAIQNNTANEWTAVFEALFTSALLFIIAQEE